MGPPTGGMMEGLLVSNSPFLGDCLDPPLSQRVNSTVTVPVFVCGYADWSPLCPPAVLWRSRIRGGSCSGPTLCS